VLKPTGNTKQSYLRISDVGRAIQTILKKGENSEAYNVENETIHYTIREKAEQVAVSLKGKIRARIELDDILKYDYANKQYLNLDTEKLQNLSWHPKYNINDMFRNLIILGIN
jgi:UDP-glucuronate decarboxylase